MPTDCPEKPKVPDWIAARCAARAAELGLTTYAVAKRCREMYGDAAPTAQSVYRLFDQETALGSRALGQVLRVLGLTLAPDTPPPAPEK